MISLIIKDVTTQVKYIGLLLSLYVVFSLIPIFPEYIYLNVGVLMVAMRLAYIEEKNNALLFLKTMPLKTSTIVMSKYLSEFVIAVFFVLVSCVNVFIFSDKGFEGILQVIASLTVILFFAGIFFMLFFKLGYMKAGSIVRIVSIFILFVFMIPQVSGRLKEILMLIGNKVPFNWMTGSIVELLVLGLYFLTAIISIQFLKRRETF